MKPLRRLASIAFALGAAAYSYGVSAAIVTHLFDFRDLTSPYAMTPDGVLLSISSDNGLVAKVDGTGTATCTPPCANDGRLQQGLNGVGVFDNIIGVGEKVSVSVSPTVGALLQAVVFEVGGGSSPTQNEADYLRVYVDGVLATEYLPIENSSNTISFSGVSGSVFEFVPYNTAIVYAPQFTLTSLTLSVDDGSQVEPIPEPATLLLVGLGLAGLAATRRRKQ